MNYATKLNSQINEIYQSLYRCGWLAAARSVEAAAESAGTDLTRLMAAHDHACWHMQQLENAGLRASNQYDRDCY